MSVAVLSDFLPGDLIVWGSNDSAFYGLVLKVYSERQFTTRRCAYDNMRILFLNFSMPAEQQLIFSTVLARAGQPNSVGWFLVQRCPLASSSLSTSAIRSKS